MPTSKGFRYPSSASAPNVPQDIQNLATDVDNWLTVTSASPTSFAAAFSNNAVTPIKAYKDSDGMVTLDGLITNVTTIANVAGTWFTLPVGYRPATLRFGLAYIESGLIASYQIDTTGIVSGLLLVVGAYTISTRYWALNMTYKAA